MALVEEFLAEISDARFHHELGRLLSGAGVSFEDIGVTFPEDLDPCEEPFEGVEIRHHIFGDVIRLPRAEFFTRLRAASDAYLRRFPFMSPIVDRLWALSLQEGLVEAAFRACAADPSEAMRLCVQRLHREKLDFHGEGSIVLESFDPANAVFMDGARRTADSWRDAVEAASSADGVRVSMTDGVILELLRAPLETAFVLHLPKAAIAKAGAQAHEAQRLSGLLLDLRAAAGAKRLAMPSRLSLTPPAEWEREDRAAGVGTIFSVDAAVPRREGEREIILEGGAVLRTRLPVKDSPSA